MMFKLNSQLEKDSVRVGSFELCELLLSKDANYPWFILVPRREGLTELYHLSSEDRQQFMRESCLLSEALVDVFAPEKINVAALGNVVSQLHIHHIARYRNDHAWPKPIWGVVAEKPYEERQLMERLEAIASVLEGEDFTPA